MQPALDFLIACLGLLLAGVILMPTFTRAIASFLLTHASGVEAYWGYWRKPQKVKAEGKLVSVNDERNRYFTVQS